MGSKNDLVSIIRRTQTLVSVLLFFIVLIFFWQKTDFKITEIQLSHWGGSEIKLGWLWNLIIIILSITILFNNIYYIYNHSRLKYKKLLYILFSLVGVSLFLVGVFNLEHKIIHNLSAYSYFFLYPLSIFLLSHLNRKNLIYKEWLINLLCSILLVIVPLSFIGIFPGLAITETAHSIIVCSWNIIIAFKIFIE
jgi:hypothetical membrane protein